MANVTTGNPFIIDTATATAIIASDRFQLLAVRWVSGSTGNVCTIQDAAGTTRWESVGEVANFVDDTEFPDELELNFNGLKVPTLDSGKVYLYVKRS
jgi:hypothetical protein